MPSSISLFLPLKAHANLEERDNCSFKGKLADINVTQQVTALSRRGNKATDIPVIQSYTVTPWQAAVGGAFTVTSCEGEERRGIREWAQTPADKQQQHIENTTATVRIIRAPSICYQACQLTPVFFFSSLFGLPCRMVSIFLKDIFLKNNIFFILVLAGCAWHQTYVHHPKNFLRYAKRENVKKTCCCTFVFLLAV